MSATRSASRDEPTAERWQDYDQSKSARESRKGICDECGKWKTLYRGTGPQSGKWTCEQGACFY